MHKDSKPRARFGSAAMLRVVTRLGGVFDTLRAFPATDRCDVLHGPSLSMISKSVHLTISIAIERDPSLWKT